MPTHSIAVDVGGSHITVGLVSDRGLETTRTLPADPTIGMRPHLDPIATTARELLISMSLTAADCHGIGLAVPFLVDSAENVATSTARDKYDDATDIDFTAWADDELGLPIKLEVDAHAACLGEWHEGAGRGSDDFVYVILGTGYGCSVIFRGHPLRGQNGLAGILGGHLAVRAGAESHDCVCPAKGCAEAETGSWTLKRTLAEHPAAETSSLPLSRAIGYRDLIEHSQAGDAVAGDILARNVEFLGASFVNLTHAYAPTRIIVGGGLMRSADLMLPQLQTYVSQHVWSVGDPPTVVAAEHPETAALHGIHSLFTRSIELL